MAEAALYYPYIHVRDPNWLKGTLLLFEQIERMVPCRNVRGDLPEVAPFTQPHGGRRPLLEPTDLWSPRAEQAQRELARKLQDTVAADPNFVIRFGEAEAIRLRSNPYGFQIHQQKLHCDLQSALWDTNLGFKPGIEEPSDSGGEYVELHPQVGQAVMSTLAVACATAGNLDIVTDQGSERLHGCLLQKEADAIFDAYLGEEADLPDPRAPDEHELFEVLLTFACDTRELDVQRLAEMGSNREPIRLLKERLKKHADAIGPLDPGPRRKQRMEEEIYDVLREWEENRANMSDFWRRFFGRGQIDNAAAFARDMVRRVGQGAAAGLGLGGVAVGAAAGLGVGFISHGWKSRAELRSQASTSPYRYLTMMEEAGVVFRSDWRLKNPRRAGGPSPN